MTKGLFIKDIMAKPTTISKSAKITEALDKMLDEGIDPLIALNNTTVVGTVSRQAIAEKLGSKQNTALAPAAIHVASVVKEDFTSVYPDESVNVLIPLLQRYKLIVVYDADHHLIGQVTAIDLLKKYPHDGSIKNAIGKTITIDSSERVVHLRRRMLDEALSRFIVTENGKLTGIVTETDVAVAMRKFRETVKDQHQDHQIRNLLVKDIMSSPLISQEITAEYESVINLMVSKNISTVPITENGKLAGIVTRRSLVQAL
ncbi:MAG: CBS domain-containing protein [Methanoregula sp.]|jgi:predicted transcriptional regulator